MVENKENLTNENFNNIAEYYEEDTQDSSFSDVPKRVIITDSDPYANEGYTPYFPRRRYNGNIIAEIAFVSACFLVGLAILFLSFYLGTLGTKDTEMVDNKYYELLETDSRYNDTLKKISSINAEIEELTQTCALKQREYDALLAYQNGEGDVDNRISELQAQLDDLTKENLRKQTEIDSLTADISGKVSTIMNLPPGIYTVGENIAAGKYTVTGSGSILVSSASGTVKLNTILTANGTTVTLNNADKIQLDTRAKFSPVS